MGRFRRHLLLGASWGVLAHVIRLRPAWVCECGHESWHGEPPLFCPSCGAAQTQETLHRVVMPPISSAMGQRAAA